MIKSIYTYTYWLALSIYTLSLTSCVINPDPIDVFIPESEKKMVVSSIGLPPFIIGVSLSKTFSAISGIRDSVNLEENELLKDILIDSADVYIDYDGKSIKLEKVIAGIYGSIEVPLIENMAYTLRAYDHGLKQDIKATTIVKSRMSFDSLYGVRIPTDTMAIHTFKYVFTDKANEENYYLVTTSRPSKKANGEEAFENIIADFVNPEYELYTDKLNGDGNKISYMPEFTTYDQNDTLIISLSHITKEYFDYLTAYKKSGNFLNSLLSEPTRTFPTNVQNGYGFFSLTLPDIRTIILE